MVLGAFLLILIPFFIASFTGGLAGAIVAGGGENRTIWANGGMGMVGWVFAFVVWRALSGSWPGEISLGTGLIALLASIALVYFLETWGTRPSADSGQVPTV